MFDPPPPDDAPSEGTRAELHAYSGLIERLAREEVSAVGDNRKRIAVVAVTLWRFLRSRSWVDEETQQAAFEAADRAGKLAVKCRPTPHPIRQG